jgi:phosphatidylinositol 4-phosphatase
MTYERFVLRMSARWITVEPFEPAVPHDKVFFTDRRVGRGKPYSVRDRIECAGLAEPDTERVIFGLVGVVDLLVDSYLIVIDGRVKVGTLFEHEVYRATKLSVVPMRGVDMLKTNPDISREELVKEESLSAMLKAAVAVPGFYFSHGIDITRSTQKRLNMKATVREWSAVPDFGRAEMRYVWNRFAGKRLADIGITSWIVPLISGYVDVREGIVNGKFVQLALVSRRCPDRPGLRYTARGADVHGNVSNFVETEQIVIHGDAFASFVQVRGSIPLLWQQEACIKYTPAMKLKAVDAGGQGGLSQAAFEKHYRSLFELYGPVTSVSLINTHGNEAMLASALQNAADLMADSRLHFVPWDFHLKTKVLGYGNVDNELVPSIDVDLGAYGYFLVTDGNSSSPSMRQKGVVRSNCIDSLDRTNVVQSVIAHRILDDALKHMKVLNNSVDTCTVSSFREFEMSFKATWADHADAVAMVYVGSGALKTDFTRTGKRTKTGMLKDGYRACVRYIYQNFFDGPRQDGIDLFLGVVTLENYPSSGGKRDIKSIMADQETLPAREKFLPHAFIACMSLGILSLFLVPRWWQKLVVVAVASGGAGVLWCTIARNGQKYVVRPRLNGTH